MDDPDALRLQWCDPARKMLRFYVLQVAPNLFGEWCLLRVWGRIGRRDGLVRDETGSRGRPTGAGKVEAEAGISGKAKKNLLVRR
jgi:predicted DNA-binding WGR domain protein